MKREGISMKTLRLIDEYFEISISVFLMSLMTVILGIQVFMRYVMGASLSWSEELARYAFIWLIYLSISYGAKQMRHIKIDAALKLFPDSWRGYVVLLADVIFLVFALYVVWTSWAVIERQLMLGQTSPAMRMPMWIVYAAPCVGFFMTGIRQIQTIIFRIKNPNSWRQEEEI